MKQNSVRILVFTFHKEELNFPEIDNSFRLPNLEWHFSADFEEFKKNFELLSPDIALIDLPDSGGEVLAFCCSLKSNSGYKHIPIALLLRTKNKTLLTSALESGIDCFIYLPLDGYEFASNLNSLLKLKEAYSSSEKVHEAKDSTENDIFSDNDFWKKVIFAYPEYVALLNTEGKFLFLNHYADGFSENDVKGKYSTDFVAESSRALFNDKLKECVDTKSTVVFEYEAYGDNYSIRNYEGHFVPVIKNEVIVCIVSSANDITDRKKAEKEMAEAEDMLIQFIRHAPIYTYLKEVTQKESKVIRVSDNFIDLVGIRASEMVGKNMSEIFPPDFAEKMNADDREVVEAGKVMKLDEQYQNKFYESIKFPIASSGKTYLGGFTIDITDQKTAEKALKESEFFFKESQKAASIGSYKTDFVKGFWESSEVLDEIFGIDKNYNRNIQGWHNMVSEEDREMMNRYFSEEVIAHQKPFNKEYRIKRISDFQVRWVLGLGECTFDGDGNILTMVGTIQDITERKQSEEEKLLFNLMIQNSLSEVYIFDAISLKFREVSRGAIENLGYSSEEIKNLTPLDLKPAYSEDEFKNLISPLLSGETVKIDFFTYHLRKDKTTYPVEVHLSISSDKKFFIAFILDISERLLAQDVLTESELQYRTLFELSPFGILIHKDGIVQFANPTAAKLLKSSALDDFVNLPLLKLVDEEYIQIVQERIKEIKAKGGEVPLIEERLVRFDGSKFYADVIARDIIIKNEYAVMVMFNDITERKRAEEALIVNEERLKQITDSSGIWVWEIDKDGLYTYINEMEESILGYKQEEVVGKKHFFDFFSPETKEQKKYEAFEIIAQKGIFNNFENANIHKDGRIVILETSGFPILDNKGNLVGYRGADKDITERYKSKEEIAFRNTILTTQQEVALDGILVIDENFNIITYNHQFAEMFKIPGKLLEDKLYAPLLNHLANLVTNREKYIERVNLIYNNREERFRDEVYFRNGLIVDRFTAPMISPEGKYFGRVWFFRDITERKKGEKELTLRLEELERFHRLSVGRELRMVELKQKINELSERIGERAPYDLAFKGNQADDPGSSES